MEARALCEPAQEWTISHGLFPYNAVLTHLCWPTATGRAVIWLFLTSNQTRDGKLLKKCSGNPLISLPSRYKLYNTHVNYISKTVQAMTSYSQTERAHWSPLDASSVTQKLRCPSVLFCSCAACRSGMQILRLLLQSRGSNGDDDHSSFQNSEHRNNTVINTVVIKSNRSYFCHYPRLLKGYGVIFTSNCQLGCCESLLWWRRMKAKPKLRGASETKHPNAYDKYRECIKT